MADPRLVTVNDFTSSIYADLADQTDVLLTDVLVAAEDDVERAIGYPIKRASYTESYRAKSQTLFLRNRPIASVTSVKRRPTPTSTWSTLPITSYTVETGPAYVEVGTYAITGWFVEVTYLAGFVIIPADIKTAIITQAALNLSGATDLELYGAGDSKEPGTAYMGRQIARLLYPYCLSKTPWR